jgi:hypothetical protein
MGRRLQRDRAAHRSAENTERQIFRAGLVFHVCNGGERVPDLLVADSTRVTLAFAQSAEVERRVRQSSPVQEADGLQQVGPVAGVAVANDDDPGGVCFPAAGTNQPRSPQPIIGTKQTFS